MLSAVVAHSQAPSQPLKAGDSIPDVTLRTEQDQAVSLRKLVAAKPTVLIFYRGGWCPYCMRHLQALEGIEKDLVAEGVQLLAISMDQPSKLRETPNRDKLHYRLLSDSSAQAVKAFGIAFTVDDATLEKYKTYHVDLEAASGQSHHILPHPSVFVVDQAGKIRFAHVNPNYKVRLDPAKILDAVREAKLQDQPAPASGR